MFKKLLDSVQARFQDKTSDHPLGSVENLDALIAGIPEADPVRRLMEVDEWLAGIPGARAEIGEEATLRAVRVLDACSVGASAAILRRYLTPGQREHLSDALWSALDAHAARVFEACALVLPGGRAATESDDQLLLGKFAARALRAWALRKKLLRFRYRAPNAAAWSAAHGMLMRAAQLGLAQNRIVAYEGEAETTPLREYLLGVYLELAPLGNLVPLQIEFTEALLRTAEAFDFAAQPGASSTYSIDPAQGSGPRRLQGPGTPGGAVRFLGTARLRGLIAKLSAQTKAGEVPPWLADLPIKPEQIEASLLALALHWAPTPPQRAAARQARGEDMMAVFGFDMARRLVAASHFARSGRSLEYDVIDIDRLYQENRFGNIAAPAPQEKPADSAVPAIVNPLDTLHRLEQAGAKVMMEAWRQIDSSETGYGAAIPAVLPRHRIGALIAARYAEGLEWRLGLIRRIGRDAANQPNVGIETLEWPSLAAMAKPVGQSSRWTEVADAGHGWIDAIVVAADDSRLVLPVDTFIEQLDIEVRSEEGLWRVRLLRLLARGVDFDLVEFRRLAP